MYGDCQDGFVCILLCMPLFVSADVSLPLCLCLSGQGFWTGDQKRGYGGAIRMIGTGHWDRRLVQAISMGNPESRVQLSKSQESPCPESRIK